MHPSIRKALKFVASMVAVALGIFVTLKFAHAADVLGGDWGKYIEGAGLQKIQGSGTGQDLATTAIRRIIQLVKYGVGGVALIFGILYATSLVMSRGNEEAISKQKKNFLWAFLGFIILMASQGISDILNPAKATSEALLDFGAARDRLRDIADYTKWMLGSVAVMLMTISGVRMMMANDNEETIEKQKKNLIWSGIGLLVVLLASNLVNMVYVVNEKGEAAPAAPTTAAQQIGGIIRLILVFMGPLAVIFTIYAGFMYLTALDNEERSKKGKSMIIGGVTGIVIIYSAYAIVNTFFTAKELTQLPTT